MLILARSDSGALCCRQRTRTTATGLEMLTHVHDVLVRQLAVEIRVERAGAVTTIDHRARPPGLDIRPLLLPASGAWVD
jgi:hypothetical protein